MLYDNGCRRGHDCSPPDLYSTAVELAVDPGDPEPVTVVWQYAQDSYTFRYGDADRLPNGNTLVTAGSSGRLLEVAQDGTVVWELTATDPCEIYQSERVLSLYPLRGDVDGDDDLDLLDFADFEVCLHGPDESAFHRSCLLHDFDEDADVDLEDFASFQAAFTG